MIRPQTPSTSLQITEWEPKGNHVLHIPFLKGFCYISSEADNSGLYLSFFCVSCGLSIGNWNFLCRPFWPSFTVTSVCFWNNVSSAGRCNVVTISGCCAVSKHVFERQKKLFIRISLVIINHLVT